MADIDVRPPQKADVRGLSRTLGRAFYDDPIMMWMLPDAARRAKSLPHMFATMTRHHFLAGGGAEIATNGPVSGRPRCGIRPGGGNDPGARSCG